MNKLIAVLNQPKFDLTELPLQIFDDHTHQVMRLDNRARNSLNCTLDADFKAVYRGNNEYKSQWKAPSIDWSGEHIVLVTSKGSLLRMNNSEWAFFEKVKLK